MAVSDEAVKAWFAANPNATDAQIVEAAKQAGVGAEQVSRVTQAPIADVNRRVANVLSPSTPLQPTGGMLGGSSISLTPPSPVSVQPTMFSTATTGPTLQQTGPTLGMTTNVYLTQPVTPMTLGTGMLEGVTTETTPAGLDDLPNFLGASLLEKAEQTPFEALGKITANNSASIANLGSFIYQANKENTQIPASIIEEIGYSISPDTTEAYNFAVHAQSVAEGYDALDKAIAAGDTAKATELRNALQRGEQDFGSYWDYYNKNLASSEGQAHSNLRKKTTTGDTVFGVGDPKGGLKGSLERGIVRLGDSIGDVVDNPFVQAAVSFAYPPAGAVLNAYATLDSGENLTPSQIAAALAGVNEMLPGGSNLGNTILSQLPESVQSFVQAADDFANGFQGRAVAALKQAFPNVDTEKLAEYSDNFTEFLAGGEDFAREVVGEENIEAISGGLASFDDARRDLFEGEFADIGDRLGGLEEMFAGITAEPSGSGFTPQRGYQPGLPVDTQFGTDERSLVMDVLNA